MQQPNSNQQQQSEAAPSGLQATTQVISSFFGGLGKMFASAVKTTIETERNAIEEESKKNISEHKKMAIPDATTPPWEDLGPNVGPEIRDRVKMLVSELSKSKTTFIPAQPIDDSKFVFNFDSAVGSARASLESDKALDEMRSVLVPRHVSENEFWKNWFWNVHLIKVSCGIDWPTPGIALPLLSPEEREKLQKQYSVDASDVALEVEMQAALQGMEEDSAKIGNDEEVIDNESAGKMDSKAAKEEEKVENKNNDNETKKDDDDDDDDDENNLDVDLDDDGNITVSVNNSGENDSNWDNDIEIDI